MPKTQQELLDQAYVREAISTVKKYTKTYSSYGRLSRAIVGVLAPSSLLLEEKITKLREQQGAEWNQVHNRYQAEIVKLDAEARQARERVDSKAKEVATVAELFFATWLLERLSRGEKIEDIFKLGQDMAAEYAAAWILEGWRPPVMK